MVGLFNLSTLQKGIAVQWNVSGGGGNLVDAGKFSEHGWQKCCGSVTRTVGAYQTALIYIWLNILLLQPD